MTNQKVKKLLHIIYIQKLTKSSPVELCICALNILIYWEQYVFYIFKPKCRN